MLKHIVLHLSLERMRSNAACSLPLRGLSTPGQGQGEGSAGDKFRVSGTQETVEGAGANEVSGVLSEASCCRCGAPLIKKKRPTPFRVDLFL
ncbi:MAG: hypothetical protein MJY48_04660 [Bacteroidales bacterium]|nr:hypothetical protein [Bacteroidales bacterium]